MKKNFESLINKDLYQVFLFCSPAHIPFSIFTHSWFVINKKGILSRYEVRYKRNEKDQSLGYIHKDNLPPFEGIEVFSFLSHPHWKAKLLGSIEGNENSEAKDMILFIENSINTYQNKNKYFGLGPNSNTYTKWILNHFPNFKGKLKWNALGKDYIN